MTIRKTASGGQIIGVDREAQAEHDAALPPPLRKLAADSQHEHRERNWTAEDEQALAAESDDGPTVL